MGRSWRLGGSSRRLYRETAGKPCAGAGSYKSVAIGLTVWESPTEVPRMSKFRTERDSMGELKVPAKALYGAQTQRAVDNFPVSGLPMPREFIRALGLIKSAAAEANVKLGHLDKASAKAIRAAAERVATGEVDEHFPIDIFQTGSGTSSNMNANEVIAHLAEAAGTKVHPNDHVNAGQSSN